MALRMDSLLHHMLAACVGPWSQQGPETGGHRQTMPAGWKAWDSWGAATKSGYFVQSRLLVRPFQPILQRLEVHATK